MTDHSAFVGLCVQPVSLLLVVLMTGSVQASQRPLTLLDEPREAPGFTLPAIDGAQRRLADYHGRYVLVNFWAVWCAPCRKEMPSMQATYEILKGEGLDLVAIHVGPSLEIAREFASRLGLEFDILVDDEMALTDWQVLGLPTTFLVDREGRLVAEAVGERDWGDPVIVRQLQALIR